MTTVFIITCSLLVVLIAMNGWLFGRDRTNRLDIEKLYEAVAQLTKETAALRRSCGSLSDAIDRAAENLQLDTRSAIKRTTELAEKVQELEKRSLDAQAVADEITKRAEEAARNVEKQWDQGLQNMLGWNPFGSGESEGGGV
jgi:FtsZ-binding cell division protein ZapB